MFLVILYWDPDNPEVNSTKGCRILALERPHLISFEWKGAKQHEPFMNHERPFTAVSVSFIPQGKNETRVTLIHTGWRNSPEWEDARQWFETAWKNAFQQLAELATTT